MATCKHSAHVICISANMLVFLRVIIPSELNFRKMYLAVVSVMAFSSGFSCFRGPGCLQSPTGCPRGGRESELMSIGQASHDHFTSTRVACLCLKFTLAIIKGILAMASGLTG